MPSPGLVCPRSSKRLLFVVVALTLFSTVGCGSGIDATAGARTLAVSPSTSMVNIGHDVSLVGSGASPDDTCSWSSSDEDVLSSTGNGVFHARDGGTASVSMTCGTATSTASVAVAKPLAVASTSIVITAGGTYSGVWNSTDPKTPAVSIRTNAPVIIQNSTITSVGDLINIKGASPTSGANVTIQNVTATALDPGAGKERGAFVTATNVTGLVVTNCTVTGASFGIAAYYSTINVLHIQNNIFNHLEDRASDGNGGFRTKIPAYGHMVILDDVIAPNGADISWNQLVNTIGSDSTEDGINIYKTTGTAANPIRAHDNYLEGYASPAQGNQYSGSGLITDGDGVLPVTAYVVFDSNEVVHTAGTGVALANGHDQQATNNRIVSCGQDAGGNWFATTFANAVIVTNYYGAPQFTNHTVSGSLGGMVRPNANSQPIPVDFWTDSVSPGDNVASNGFTNPCFVSGKIWLAAENNERAFWAAKLKAKSIVIGSHR